MAFTFVPPFAPPAWANQDILLYHGTDDVSARAILGGILLGRSRARIDFGPGFYTTTRLHQAWDWARACVARQVRHSPHLRAAVVEFQVSRDALSALDTIGFVGGDRNDLDYWSLVFHCRNGGMDHGRPGIDKFYDVVIGPVASSFRHGMIHMAADQISFHSARATSTLDGASKDIGIAT